MTDTLGRKFDSGKTRLGLLPPLAIESVGRVLTFGAEKYAKDNWKYVDGAVERYLDASLRHIFAYLRDEQDDPESGEHHLAHAVCCLMFVLDLDLAQDQQSEEDVARINRLLGAFHSKLEGWPQPKPTPGWHNLQQATDQRIKGQPQ